MSRSAGFRRKRGAQDAFAEVASASASTSASQGEGGASQSLLPAAADALTASATTASAVSGGDDDDHHEGTEDRIRAVVTARLVRTAPPQAPETLALLQRKLLLEEEDPLAFAIVLERVFGVGTVTRSRGHATMWTAAASLAPLAADLSNWPSFADPLTEADDATVAWQLLLPFLAPVARSNLDGRRPSAPQRKAFPWVVNMLQRLYHPTGNEQSTTVNVTAVCGVLHTLLPPRASWELSEGIVAAAAVFLGWADVDEWAVKTRGAQMYLKAAFVGDASQFAVVPPPVSGFCLSVDDLTYRNKLLCAANILAGFYFQQVQRMPETRFWDAELQLLLPPMPWWIGMLYSPMTMDPFLVAVKAYGARVRQQLLGKPLSAALVVSSAPPVKPKAKRGGSGAKPAKVAKTAAASASSAAAEAASASTEDAPALEVAPAATVANSWIGDAVRGLVAAEKSAPLHLFVNFALEPTFGKSSPQSAEHTHNMYLQLQDVFSRLPSSSTSSTTTSDAQRWARAYKASLTAACQPSKKSRGGGGGDGGGSDDDDYDEHDDYDDDDDDEAEAAAAAMEGGFHAMNRFSSSSRDEVVLPTETVLRKMPYAPAVEADKATLAPVFSDACCKMLAAASPLHKPWVWMFVAAYYVAVMETRHQVMCMDEEVLRQLLAPALSADAVRKFKTPLSTVVIPLHATLVKTGRLGSGALHSALQFIMAAMTSSAWCLVKLPTVV